MDILIIEDEPKIAADLARILTRIEPTANIVDKLDTVESSIAYLSTNDHPDLIFSDIRLADGLAFSIFEQVALSCPVVFITAYDEYALQAFKVNSIDYILKPFDTKSVEIALTKFRSLSEHYSKDTGLKESVLGILKSLSKPGGNTILISSGDKYIPVLTKEIAYFYLEDGLTEVHMFDGKWYSISLALEEIERRVNSNSFYRANRQYLVNFDAIYEVAQFFSRKLKVKLKTPVKEPVIVSKAKSGDFLAWMKSH